MRVLAIGIELPDFMAVQRLHDADASQKYPAMPRSAA
jgi:hypothetical protein